MSDGNHRLRAQNWSTGTYMVLAHGSCMRTGMFKGQLSVGWFSLYATCSGSLFKTWKLKNKVMRHMGKLSREKNHGEGRCLLYKQVGASFTSELGDTAIKNLFCWWLHNSRHRAFAVREVPADCCRIGPTSAYGCNPGCSCTPHTHPGSLSTCICPENRDPLLTLPQTPPTVHLPTSTLHPGEHNGVTGICHVYNLSCKTQDKLNTFPWSCFLESLVQ